MRFVVVGCTTVDVLAGGLSRLPTVRAGDEFTPQTLVELPAPPAVTIGGNGGNVAYALARLGRPATVLTCLGEDAFGRQAEVWLDEVGVETVRVPPHRTSCNLVATDRDGNRYSFFHPVAYDDPALIAAAGDHGLNPGDHLHIAGFPHPGHATLSDLLDLAVTAGASTSLDIGPALSGFRVDTVLALASRLDVLFASREELAGLDPESEVKPDAIAGRVRTAVVVKGGAAGARAITPDGAEEEIAPQPLDATVTVGAGDAFNAGFLAATAMGADVRRALRAGDAVAHEVLVRGRGVLAAPTPDDLPTDVLPRHEGQPKQNGKDR